MALEYPFSSSARSLSLNLLNILRHKKKKNFYSFSFIVLSLEREAVLNYQNYNVSHAVFRVDTFFAAGKLNYENFHFLCLN